MVLFSGKKLRSVSLTRRSSTSLGTINEGHFPRDLSKTRLLIFEELEVQQFEDERLDDPKIATRSYMNQVKPANKNYLHTRDDEAGY